MWYEAKYSDLLNEAFCSLTSEVSKYPWYTVVQERHLQETIAVKQYFVPELSPDTTHMFG